MDGEKLKCSRSVGDYSWEVTEAYNISRPSLLEAHVVIQESICEVVPTITIRLVVEKNANCKY